MPFAPLFALLAGLFVVPRAFGGRGREPESEMDGSANDLREGDAEDGERTGGSSSDPAQGGRDSASVAAPLEAGGSSREADLYVATDGSDDADGTIEAPFATIEHAISVAGPGDLIYVRGGVYEGPVDIWSGGREDAPLHIMAHPGETAIIDGSGTPPDTDLVAISAPHVIFEGFEVANSTGTGIAVWSTHNVEILDNVIHDTESGGLWVGADRLGVSSDHLIEGNVIFNTALMNEERALDEGWPRALAIDATTDTIVRDNIVFKNYGEGIGALSSTDIQLTDNIVYDNFSVQIYLDNTQDIAVTDNKLFETGDEEFYRKDEPGIGVLIANERTEFEMSTTGIRVSGNTYAGVETARYDGSYGWGGGITDSVLGPGIVISPEEADPDWLYEEDPYV